MRFSTDPINRFIDDKLFSLQRLMLLRIEAMPRPTRVAMPCLGELGPTSPKGFTVGYSCNLLNNSYILYRIARRRGVPAWLFLDPDFADLSATAHPAWEEVDHQCRGIPQTVAELPPFTLPPTVAIAKWRLALLEEVARKGLKHLADLFRDAPVAIDKNDLESLLLAYSVVPHQELLSLYSKADVLHVSGSHVGLASFTTKPYVTMPYGSDLYSMPFEDTEIGWMQARGFRRASRHIVTGKIMLEYMEAQGIPRNKIDLMPFIVDTEVYKPLAENPVRDELRRKHPGKVLFLLGARQNFHWKGNHKLWKALSMIRHKLPNAVFLSVWYGQDVAESQKMLQELGLTESLVLIDVLSKGLLRQYIDAVDVCIDQFTLGCLGTFSLESLSIGKPLITYLTAEKHFEFVEGGPVLNCHSEGEIAEHVGWCIDNPAKLKELGLESRAWVSRYHGHEAVWPQIYDSYSKAIADEYYRK